MLELGKETVIVPVLPSVRCELIIQLCCVIKWIVKVLNIIKEDPDILTFLTGLLSSGMILGTVFIPVPRPVQVGFNRGDH